MNQNERIKEMVISDEALFDSMTKCKKGVMYKSSVAFFYLHCMNEITKLSDELRTDQYKARKAKTFEITSPKHRTIVSIAFRDRVFQRSLNDLVIYPAMTKQFIYDNAACQKGKGTDFARNRLKEFLHRFYRRHGTEGYVLKIDIKKYYDNISHDYAKEIFREKLDDWSYQQVEKIIDTQYLKEKGFNAGSQVIQILGISALNKVDHFIKEKLRIKYYIRYQDDFILFHSDANYLEFCKKEIEKKLIEVGLEFNKKKTKIIPITNRIEFLGFDYRLTTTGKVIMSVSSKKVKTEKRHLRKMIAKSKRGELPKHKVDEHFESVINHYSLGNSNKLIARMRKYYRELWRN